VPISSALLSIICDLCGSGQTLLLGKKRFSFRRRPKQRDAFLVGFPQVLGYSFDRASLLRIVDIKETCLQRGLQEIVDKVWQLGQ